MSATSLSCFGSFDIFAPQQLRCWPCEVNPSLVAFVAPHSLHTVRRVALCPAPVSDTVAVRRRLGEDLDHRPNLANTFERTT